MEVLYLIVGKMYWFHLDDCDVLMGFLVSELSLNCVPLYDLGGGNFFSIQGLECWCFFWLVLVSAGCKLRLQGYSSKKRCSVISAQHCRLCTSFKYLQLSIPQIKKLCLLVGLGCQDVTWQADLVLGMHHLRKIWFFFFLKVPLHFHLLLVGVVCFNSTIGTFCFLYFNHNKCLETVGHFGRKKYFYSLSCRVGFSCSKKPFLLG